MKTSKTIFAVLCFLISLALTGCAGVRAALDVTQYAAGTYAGTYQSRDGSQNGNITFTVYKEGNIVGSGHNNTLNTDFTVQAHLSNQGNIRGTFITNGNSDPVNGSLDYEDDQLSGDLTQTLDDGSKLVLDFNLRKQ